MSTEPYKAKAMNDPSPQGIAAEERPLDESAAWFELARLGQEMGRDWRSSQAGAELLSKMRREENVRGYTIPPFRSVRPTDQRGLAQL